MYDAASVLAGFKSLYSDPRHFYLLLNGGTYYYGVTCSCSVYAEVACVISLATESSNTPSYSRREPEPMIGDANECFNSCKYASHPLVTHMATSDAYSPNILDFTQTTQYESGYAKYIANMYKYDLANFWNRFGMYGFPDVMYIRNYKPNFWHSEDLYQTILERLIKFRCTGNLEEPDLTKRFNYNPGTTYRDFEVANEGKQHILF